MHTVKRLINHFTPSHYNINLTIDRKNRQFTGTTTITGTSVNGEIIVHAKNLNISSVSVNDQPAVWQEGQDDEITISTPAPAPGKHVVTINYRGQINSQLHGLYPCKYKFNGKNEELLATQFESHYAREVFPCVDEPAAKATFDLTLTTEPNVTVLSNMPVKNSKNNAASKTTTFKTTPKMSTYLLAFVVGNLQKASGQTKDGVKVNIYATPAQPKASLQFALQHSIKTIEFFNDYFNTPYPLPKSDQVALPDFSNGAMENWGLVTYRESALLYDPAATSLSSKQYIATVISHELSHQWFGNLVTMQWWDDLWLNESFATIMEYVCVDALYPEWNAWLMFNTNESVYALRRDSLEGVQPVKVDVHHPDEIQSVFDGAIVYAKGARLLRMLQQYIGEKDFRAGLALYFQQHAYGNTIGQDLWNALETASGKKIGDFMNAWLTQSGFPVVSASRSQGNINLAQQQFFIDSKASSQKLWPIPLDNGELFTGKNTVLANFTAPFMLNAHDTAHFITHYNDELLNALLEHIKSGSMEPIGRAAILKEQLLLAKSPFLSSAYLVSLLQAYKRETNERVWSLISGALNDLKRFVDPNTPAEQALKQLACTIASPLYQTLGWETKPGESHENTMLRSTIIATMLYGEDKATISQARQLYREQTPEQMDSELRDLIMLSETRFGDSQQAINSLLALHSTTQSVDLKQSICDAVTGTYNTAELEKLIGLLKDTSVIRTQDTVLWYVRLLSNRYSRDSAWQWLQNEWPWIYQTFSGDKSYDAFVRYTGQILSDRRQLEEYVAFFTPLLKDTALKRAITVGINDITARVELLERDKDDVLAALLK